MIDNELYYDDVKYVANLELPWEKIKDSTVMITGASGLIGSALIDSIMYRNLHNKMNCTIFAIGRNVEKAKQRFFGYWENDCFNFIVHDINLPLDDIFPNKIDILFIWQVILILWLMQQTQLEQLLQILLEQIIYLSML